MDLGSFIAAGGVALFVTIFVTLALTVGVMLFGLWLVYTVIWRAVRRGLREFHAGGTPLGTALYPPADGWSLGASTHEPSSRRPAPIRPTQGPRDW